MAQELLSGAWYRVADLRPRLRSHVRVNRHEYRGERWYVIADRISRRTHRVNPAAWFFVGLMNGRRRLQEVWDAAVERFGDDAPSQDEAIQLLGQLHAADLLQCDVSPDVDELLRRTQRIAQRGWIARALSPLAIRIPLLDPERLLERWLPWYRPLFGPAGFLLWLAVVGWGLFAALQHWDQLTQDLSHRVLEPENLLILGLAFPVVKALHEFGHACAVKAWGGEVHEMGIMLLVLMPVPYVDASSASAFPEKRRRVVVGAAGMLVELFIASLALLLWLEMQPGVARAVLFNVVLIAGVSTVLFNANPLLRFDGYYILADLLEMPNLRQRAQQYAASVAQRVLFGMPAAPLAAGAGEKALLLGFLAAAFAYRMLITLAIALFIANEYFVIGVVLAAWAVAGATLLPLGALVNHLAFSPRLGQHRRRAALVSAALAAALLALLFLVPVPSWTNAQGVVSIPEQSMVRAATDGFVTRVLARPGAAVRRGEPLAEMHEPVMQARQRSLEGQVAELESRYQSERQERQVRAQMTLDQLKSVTAELQRVRGRQQDLVLRSPADGTFSLAASAEDLPGRFLKQGEPVGHVVADVRLTARVVVPQQSVELVRGRTERVGVKLAEQLGETLASRILREVPRASDRLPSAALSQAGGGDAALDPRAGGEARSLQTYFEFEVELPQSRAFLLGGRAYVRFEHAAESAGAQVWRWLRQLFLLRLAV